ncbi:MAG TPA: anthranilate synthase component I family protein, partial [Polyangiaceae bacterium]|nr:anthranilate synthase component I family protein [Polyangiaceae bacterium]
MWLRETPLVPDPLALARALAGRPGLAVLASAPGSGLRPADSRFSFVACEPVETSEDLVPSSRPEGPGFAGLDPAPRWIGAVPYEAFRHLERRARDRTACAMRTARWHRYDAVLRVDHEMGRVSVEADDAHAGERLLRAAAGAAPSPRDATLSPAGHGPRGEHEARIRAALDYIARGDIYQVNLARRLSFRLEGEPLDLFGRVLGKARPPYGVYWAMNDETVVCGTSPELALEVRGETLRTGPIKGTRPRGSCASSDETLRRELEASDKERAELVMAIDLHRNDLGRVARVGSVRVLGEPRTLVGPTVHSRVAEVVARRDVASDLSAVVEAVLPCGSVTGAPKVRAMEIIAELEAHPRGLYTGALGYVGRDGSLVLAMAIRTAVLSRDGERWLAEYFVGGGIV